MKFIRNRWLRGSSQVNFTAREYTNFLHEEKNVCAKKWVITFAKRKMSVVFDFDQNAFHAETFHRLDTYSDNFAKIAGVKTDLLFGNPAAVVEPVISVIVPTFQRQESFCHAIDSVLSQQATDIAWECLVMDNTPLDSRGMTPALKEVEKRGDYRVLYYHNQVNIGAGYNWNRGVELARGKWICFLHDDDVLCIDALQKISVMLRNGRNANKNLGYLNARRVDFRGNFGSRNSTEFGRYPQELLTRFGTLICGHTGAGAPTCGTVILKKAYLEAGGINYDFGLSADAVLCYQIMKEYSVVNTNYVIGGYRWNENTTLSKKSLLELIETDDMLMTYVYGRNVETRLWGKCFGGTISWRNIYRKRKIAQEYGVEVSKVDFQKATAYEEPSRLRKSIFLGIYALYRLWRLIDGWVWQLILEIIGGRGNGEKFG